MLAVGALKQLKKINKLIEVIATQQGVLEILMKESLQRDLKKVEDKLNSLSKKTPKKATKKIVKKLPIITRHR